MADINIGQTFIDHHATNYYGEKSKYFVALSCADCPGDEFVCFVMNTEKQMEKYKLWCNKWKQKFIIPPGTLSFVSKETAVMLANPLLYRYDEILNSSHIKLLDVAPVVLFKQIKNCIDWNYIPRMMSEKIKAAFSSIP